jgi:hypothetical protein
MPVLGEIKAILRLAVVTKTSSDEAGGVGCSTVGCLTVGFTGGLTGCSVLGCSAGCTGPVSVSTTTSGFVAGLLVGFGVAAGGSASTMTSGLVAGVLGGFPPEPKVGTEDTLSALIGFDGVLTGAGGLTGGLGMETTGAGVGGVAGLGATSGFGAGIGVAGGV